LPEALAFKITIRKFFRGGKNEKNP